MAPKKRFQVLMPEEIWAAQTMLCPSIVAASFALAADAKQETIIAAVGCMMHCPFSYTLHMHRALVDDPVTRTKIYKFDASFIHIHSLLTGYAWFMKPSWIELVYHACCILNIARSDPLSYPKVKNTIDILCAVGVIKCAIGIVYRSPTLFAWAVAFWGIAFFIHNRKLLGPMSSAVFHALLAVPQYFILCACQYYTVQ
mmetsp:Transcript_46534/g.93891  ORF Transcript_46534/g.93891 Transcript_46534/m.93891 type:complete len:199 (-) Transcript_46534:50-646(-)